MKITTETIQPAVIKPDPVRQHTLVINDAELQKIEHALYRCGTGLLGVDMWTGVRNAMIHNNVVPIR